MKNKQKKKSQKRGKSSWVFVLWVQFHLGFGANTNTAVKKNRDFLLFGTFHFLVFGWAALGYINP